jgi:hypothetical protein
VKKIRRLVGNARSAMRGFMTGQRFMKSIRNLLRVRQLAGVFTEL